MRIGWIIFMIFVCQAGLAQESTHHIAVYQIAFNKYYAKQYGEAIPLFEYALKAEPDADKYAYSCLGYCYYYTENYDKAIENYRISLDKYPDVNTGHCLRVLAFSYYENRAYEDALKCCDIYDKINAQLQKLGSSSKENRVNTEDIHHLKAKAMHEIDVKALRVHLKNNPLKVHIKNLGVLVNDVKDDIAPIVNADESMLLFTSFRKHTNASFNTETKQWDGDFYYCLSENGGTTWSKAKSLSSAINTNSQEGPCTMSADGHTVYFYRWFSETGGDIVESRVNGTQWSTPKRLSESINTSAWETQPTVSSDGNLMIFVRAPSYNKPSDLWYTTKDAQGQWSMAKNLGKNVNTELSEFSPFLHPDGKTLYFSSNGHPGMGGFDIFRSHLQADGTWSKPENVGYPINTERDDEYFALNASGSRAYIVSNREDTQGRLDIYQIEMPEENRPNPLTTLVGFVKHEYTYVPLGCKVIVEEAGTKKKIGEFVANETTGKFIVVLPAGKKYGVKLEKQGYESRYAVFDVPANYQQVRKTIKLKPLEKSGSFDLRPKDELSGF